MFYRIKARSGEKGYFRTSASIQYSLPSLLEEFEQSGKQRSFEGFANWLMYNKGLIAVVTDDLEIDANYEIELPL